MQTDKKNRKGEALKKPEITEDLTNLCEAWIGHTKFSYPCCRKAAKWRKKIVLFLLRLAALNNFILFKKYKYTTSENQNDKDCAFKDFILNCVEKT